MKMLVVCQYMENYGTTDQPHWKYKGGEEFFIPLHDVPMNEMFGKKAKMVMDSFMDQMTWDDEYSKQFVKYYEIVEDDALSPYEKDQLEFDGEILFPVRILEHSTV